MSLPVNQYPECEGCINAKLDPFRCQGCKNGSNYEGEDFTDADSTDDQHREFQILFGDL